MMAGADARRAPALGMGPPVPAAFVFRFRVGPAVPAASDVARYGRPDDRRGDTVFFGGPAISRPAGYTPTAENSASAFVFTHAISSTPAQNEGAIGQALLNAIQSYNNSLL